MSFHVRPPRQLRDGDSSAVPLAMKALAVHASAHWNDDTVCFRHFVAPVVVRSLRFMSVDQRSPKRIFQIDTDQHRQEVAVRGRPEVVLCGLDPAARSGMCIAAAYEFCEGVEQLPAALRRAVHSGLIEIMRRAVH